ncbi:MAG: outer membrane protein assembly factor BamD [Hymenobacteraceae bacterium]|nr:outer membrane protein assembly factor BamD [Hymenobacteraceae bacterium]MDX5395516.1 outer membrane protein assembly factor BamD [Hymenobacteraceae bacterium]MDX5443375.1 outer membrane protein assembly factor BamD [Hymenobacteraceae bacterium]MDX5511570.1 outer membrane protein assembly factor BamD [Hymenobacteraceae bacterium]
MIKNVTKLVAMLCLLLSVSSCSDFQKILKSDSIEKKYDAAVAYYEKGDYYRAGILLEELIPLMRGSNEAERAQYLYAKSQFEQKNYILSSYYFQSFYQTYPRSPYVEEAMFLNAKSLYKDSPNFNLDQTNTYSAMEAITDFLTRYPNSQYAAEAREMEQSLLEKLEVKAFENAKLYHQMRYYKAAVVALQTFLKDYPESEFAEEAAYLKLDSQYNLARLSVEDKQQERYYDAIAFYQSFIDRFPNSKYLKSAENMYTNSLNEIEKLRAVSQSN